MANDFGFRDLAWFKFAGQKCFDILYPLRSKEIQLDKEILHLLGQVDVKQAELRNLHLRAVLEARRAGLSKKDLEDAVNMEKEERKKFISVPSSQDYIPGRVQESKRFGSNVKSTKPFAEEEDKKELASIMQEAVQDLEGKATPRLGLSRRSAPSNLASQKSDKPKSLEDYLPEEWGHDATPTPKHGIPIAKVEEENPGLLGRLLSPVKKNGVFPRIYKEEVNKKKDDNR